MQTKEARKYSVQENQINTAAKHVHPHNSTQICFAGKIALRTKISLRIQKSVRRLLLSLALPAAGCCFFLAACGNTAGDSMDVNMGNASPDAILQDEMDPDTPFRKAPAVDPMLPVGILRHNPARFCGQQASSPFHSVPYFQDDTGRGLQRKDGFLYSYWNGDLFRGFTDSVWRRKLLFSADSAQSGRFCIYEDYIYFLEKPHTASLTGADTCLYRVGTDGGQLQLLTSQVPNNTLEYSSYNNYYSSYDIDIYEDIIYLMSDSSCENIYYRVDGETGAVVRLDESKTLYGLLPEGYSAPSLYPHLPSLPYQMRHYGYLFLMDKAGDLAVFAPESGRLEPITLLKGMESRQNLFLTNDALYYAEEESGQTLVTWYRISLDHMTPYDDILQSANSHNKQAVIGKNREKWISFFSLEGCDGAEIFQDKSAAYFVIKGNGLLSLYRIPWDGSVARLLFNCHLAEEASFIAPAYGFRDLYFTDGKYFYYTERSGSAYCVRRTALNKSIKPDPDIYILYTQDRTAELCVYDTREHNFTIQAEISGEDFRFPCSTALTKVLLSEDSEGARAVNAYLNQIYQKTEKKLKEFEQTWLEQTCLTGNGRYHPRHDGLVSYVHVTARPNYLDGHYLGITITEESYCSGDDHPGTWSEEYVFDLITGKRLAVTDFVENTPEEICKIAAAYADADHPGLDFMVDSGMYESFLEDFRFFLSEEGIGFHYNTYELGSYAEGNEDYIIPFWEFNLKEDTIHYTAAEKVQWHYQDTRLEEGEIPPYALELEQALAGQLLAEQTQKGSLPAFLEEHSSRFRELSFQESLTQMAADGQGVLKQYYISGKKPDDKWLYLEDSQDIWIRQDFQEQGVHYQRFYHFPRCQGGYGAALDICWTPDSSGGFPSLSSEDEYYFLSWEGTDYLILPGRDEQGRIVSLSTCCLLEDDIYNGWILRQTCEGNGEISTSCLFYWI